MEDHAWEVRYRQTEGRTTEEWALRI